MVCRYKAIRMLPYSYHSSLNYTPYREHFVPSHKPPAYNIHDSRCLPALVIVPPGLCE